MSRIDVLRAGPLTTVQDGGRPGWAHLGVPPSGAVDPRSLGAANRLVGNDPHAAALEATLVGPALRFDEAVLVAVVGADAGLAAHVATVGAGEVLDVGRCTRGVRAYIAVRGGIDAEPALGSRSTDLLTGLGPAPLRDGDVLRIGAEPSTAPADVEVPELPDDVVLRVRPGPRDDWFAPGALDALVRGPWRVDPASNRVGVRLQGPQLERAVEGELLSEGVVTGALQVPPSGRPILLLNDHPTTGGYPVIGVVHHDDLWLAGQLAPGATLRFTLEQRLSRLQ